jgi:hypothetical protein
MGVSYKLYLQDTSILQHQHANALKKESYKVMKLLGSNKDVLSNIIPVDDDMGDYLFSLGFSVLFLSLFIFCILVSHNNETSCSLLCPSVATFRSQEACMPNKRFG